MTDEQNIQDAAANGAQGAQFNLRRIYIKDLSFEAPLGIDAFKQRWDPKINQDLSTKINKIEEGVYEVVLRLTITGKMEDDKTGFLIEIQQAGLFIVTGLEQDRLTYILNTTCPAILFPYAREAVDNMLTKGSFPPVLLPPINFEALFNQAVEQHKAKEAAGEAAVN